MSIYRGPGGSGDAVNDAASEASLISQLVTQAQQSEAAAAASATAAQTAENNAETAETNAELAETNAEAAQAAAEAAQLAAEVAQAAAELAETNAETAETNAETAQAAAEAAQLAAEAAQLAAETAETNAETAETNAETAALNASNSEIAAAASAAAAAASFDAFDDIYLGAKASDPTLDNDGNALTSGDQYFNTVANELRVWNGSSWQAASVIGGTVTTLTVTGSTSLQAVSATSITDSGNLTFTGTGNRITGDFSNATIANRVMFQTSTTNGATTVEAIPNGTSTTSAFISENSSTTDNSFTSLQTSATASTIVSGIRGTGTYLPLTMFTGGSERLRIDTSGNVGIGTSSPYAKLGIVQGTAGYGGWKYGASFDATDYPAIRFLGTTANTGAIIGHDSASLVFLTGTTSTAAGAERMRIDSSGNVGIGVTPAQRFHVQGGRVRLDGNAENFVLQLNNSTTGNGPFLGSAGADILTISASSGAERMRIDSSGNVGIGTSSPASYAGKLVVLDGYITAASSSGAGYINLYSGAATTNQKFMRIGTSSGSMLFESINDAYTTPTERMRIDSSGNVGIGSTSLTNAFTVARGAGVAAGADFMGNANTTSTALFVGQGGASQGFIYNRANEGLYFGTNNTERMRIDSSGNVGIGTSSLALTLNVKSPSSDYRVALFETASTNGPSVQIKGSKTYELRSTNTGASEGGGLFFIYDKDNEISRLTINSSGNVGIGITDPSANGQLSVLAPSGGIAYGLKGRSSDGYGRFQAWDRSGTVGTGSLAFFEDGTIAFNRSNTGSLVENMRIDSSGNLLVGTTTVNGNPGWSIQPSGAGYIQNAGQASGWGFLTFGRSGTTIGSITQNGTTQVLYNTASDYRLKENQQPLTGAKDFVLALQPKTWTWKSDGSKGTGFIAHEAQKVATQSVNGEKDAVDEDGNPKYQSMQAGSSEIIANLVAFVQEQQVMIEELKAKVAALEAA